MIQLPISRIIELIVQQSKMDASDVRSKITAKLTEFSGLLSEEGAAHIIANELGVDLTQANGEPLKITHIAPGLKDITVIGKVLAVYELKEFESQRGAGQVQAILIGDETGLIRVTFWHEDTTKINCQKDDVLKMTHLSAKLNQERVELTASANTQLEKLDIEVAVIEKGSEMSTINYRKTKVDGAKPDEQVTLFGVIVNMTSPYFYPVDPNTNKKITGDLESQPHNWQYVANCTIDDGTGSVRVAAFREQALDLLQISEEEMQELRTNTTRFSDIQAERVGTYCKVSGKITHNTQYDRTEMIANVIDTNPSSSEDITPYYESTK